MNIKIKRMRLTDNFNNLRPDARNEILFIEKHFSLMNKIYNGINLILSLISLKIALKKIVVFLVIINDNIEGMCYLILRGVRAELAIFLNKEYRGMGIGTKLINVVLSWAKENKYDVWCSTEKVMYFYKKVGFKVYKKNKKNYYMEKRCVK